MATKQLKDLKPGTWFKFNNSNHRCKYMGKTVLDLKPNNTVYLFIRKNGQGYFCYSGERPVTDIADHYYSNGMTKRNLTIKK